MPRIAHKRLSKRVVEAITVPAGKTEVILHDSALRGFGVRVKASGSRTFFLKYLVGGRTRRFALGQLGALTVEQARTLAERTMGEVREGGDPSAERREDRKASTLEELSIRYFEEHANRDTGKKKDRSIAEDRRILDKYILPKLGNHKIAAISRADVSALHHAMRETPIMANRVRALLSKLFNLAEGWGLRPDHSNPCYHVKPYAENKRERYLTPEELARLGSVLADVEREGAVWPTIPAMVRLVLFTGTRHDEIRTLQWDHVDLAAGVLRLPDSKTGAKLVNLPPAAREVLATMPRVEGNPFVIFGALPGKPLVNVKKYWALIRERAELGDLRIHDLRHSFASEAVSGGASLPLIGALLGHTQAQTTQRYAHLYRAPVAEAGDRAGDRLAAKLNPPAKPKGEVIELRRGGGIT